MMKKIFALLVAVSPALSLAACGAPQDTPSAQEDGVFTIAATTYPVYELVQTVVGGREDYEVKLAVNQQLSCLHDYTLTVDDMRTIESADVIVINGAGLEAFMEDLLSTVTVPVIDCSEGIELLPYSGHEDHGHSSGEDAHEHYDPHIWLDPWRLRQMLDNVAFGLAGLDDTIDPVSQIMMPSAHIERRALAWQERFDALPQEQKYLITFHDGFSYLADAYGLTILKSIEEEAGSGASAKDIVEIVALIREYDIPMIFVEENGSDATARAIQRETGVEIGTLSMLMSESEWGYIETEYRNLETIYNGLTGSEVTDFGQ